MTGAEKTKQSDNDQIDCDNVVQELWKDKNDNTRNKCQDWTNAEVQIHKIILSSTTAFSGIIRLKSFSVADALQVAKAGIQKILK